MHAWLLSNTSSSRVLGSTSSWAWNACVHVRGKQAVQQDSRWLFHRIYMQTEAKQA